MLADFGTSYIRLRLLQMRKFEREVYSKQAVEYKKIEVASIMEVTGFMSRVFFQQTNEILLMRL